MGMGAALKLHQVIGNVSSDLWRSSCSPPRRVSICWRRSRTSAPLEPSCTRDSVATVPVWEEDRQMGLDLEKAEAFLATGIDRTSRGSALRTDPGAGRP